MLVRANDRDEVIEVYGIYWVGGERIYWIVPYENYEGFITLSESESTVVDPIIDNFVIRKNDAGEDLFLHWAADKNDLIYSLVEHDPEAMKQFNQRLSEGGF
ncbi:hypothetical protein EZI54_23335 [Marinobacter halodurans]|uniref:Uncharacterized protein n=1 Tax=Marinobacter halodurans TaxID=2528979 RepID=A0ABY1ZFS0_9GAMM|nr:hypothetical protein [Marinobacter halodurans]TBW45983.1 hypothetical protein EZI54_23335 [Marinobacter halodurans]